MKKVYVLLSVIVAIGFATCKKDSGTDLPPFNPTPLTITIPAGLPIMVIPTENQTTVEGVQLGRMLYYDSLLDMNHARACGGCHLQKYGFTTPGKNVVPHINLGYSNKFLWNGAVQGSLEDAMVFEVEEFFKTDVTKFQMDADYPTLFYKAFGTTEITTKQMAFALAQFLRTMVSGNSKFDLFVRHQTTFNGLETDGFFIFNSEKGDCFHCHSLTLMTDGNLHNNGIDSVFTGVNAGYYNVSGKPSDLGKFKSPSLRNVALRTTYMHDGRFTSLDEVIDFYDSGVHITPSVDPIMTKPGKENGLELTPYDKDALKAFLNTLTDTVYINYPAFSNPFK